MVIPIKTSVGSYDIIFENGALNNVGKHFNLNRKVLVVTDDGVPVEYSQAVENAAKESYTVTIPQGESSKQIDMYQFIIKRLIEHSFTRTDCVVAVGGGVVGDLAGFAAATFMRGIDFYNIPTTLLSQVDSSIGGKTAIDFGGIKNIIGAFYPPKSVIIDPETLKTLSKRQLSNGLAEALKMSLTSDEELFALLEKGEINKNIEAIIERSLMVKKAVVETDEHEQGLRKVLNFGHTLAHAIESVNEFSDFYHGECVALGMVPMCSIEVRKRLLTVLKKLELPFSINESGDSVIEACKHDKKLDGCEITIVYVEKIGSFVFKKMPFSQLEVLIRQVLK